MGKVDKERTTLPSPPIAEEVDHTEDRRLRGDRIDVSFPVFATYKGSLIQGFVHAINLSWSGMGLITNFPLNLNDSIELEFTLPDSHLPIRARARVIHKLAETQAEEATQIGVAFEELEPNIRRMIAGFVLENLPDY